jgi:hypothetical protein
MNFKLARIFILSGFSLIALAVSLFTYTLGTTLIQAMVIDGTEPVHLTLLPDKPTLSAGEETLVSVFIHPNNRQVTAAELHLTLDPTVFEFTSTNPFITSPEGSPTLTWVLPNCQAGPPPAPEEPCPAQGIADNSHALIYLAAYCTETGCVLPSTSEPFEIAKVGIRAKAVSPTVSTIASVTESTSATLIAAIDSDLDVTGNAVPLSLSVTACNLKFDLVPNNIVDVVDIMQVASRWNSTAQDDIYRGQLDFDYNHQINIVDIQQIASQWSQTCQP